MSYPQTVDLPSTSPAARSQQESNTGGKGQAIREPFSSVTNAVKNPHLLSLAQRGWEDVENGGGPATEAGHSQITNTTSTSATGPPAALRSGGINDADSGVQNGPSGPIVQALDAGSASRGHETRNATICSGMSVSSMRASDDKTDKSSYGTANAPFVDHEVSYMAPWAQDNINNLSKE